MAVHHSPESEPRVHPRTNTIGTVIDPVSVDLSRVHVLAVDDEPDALTLVSEVLQNAGRPLRPARLLSACWMSRFRMSWSRTCAPCQTAMLLATLDTTLSLPLRLASSSA